MNATFRPQKKSLYLGLVCTAFFSAAIVGYGLLITLRNPQANGFRNANAVVWLGCIGVGLFGTMFVLSLYLVASYFFQRFSVEGTTLRIRSVFRDEPFDVAALKQLVWNTRSQKVVLHTIGRKAVLPLESFSPDDQLSIVRIVRALVPKHVQIDWNEFCHFFALPLREGRRVRRPGTIQFDIESLPESQRVLITRRRYDVFFGMLFLMALAGGAVAWWGFGILDALTVLACILFFWALLRFSTPRKGKWDARWSATKERKYLVIAKLIVPLMFVVAFAFKFAGFNHMIPLYIGTALICAICFASIRHSRRREKEQRAKDEAETSISVGKWKSAELEELLPAFDH